MKSPGTKRDCGGNFTESDISLVQEHTAEAASSNIKKIEQSKFDTVIPPRSVSESKRILKDEPLLSNVALKITGAGYDSIVFRTVKEVRGNTIEYRFLCTDVTIVALM
jgi:hypothetical protein